MDRRFEAAFEAAARGNLEPVREALRGERRPELIALLRARLAASRYQPGLHRDAELARIAAGARDPGLRQTALSLIMAAAFADGDYRAAAEAGGRLAALPAVAGNAQELAAVDRTRALAALLAAHPPQRVEGAAARGRVPLRHDAVGLPRIDVAVNGGAQEAVVDSGANLSVLSAGAAQRLGVRTLDTAASVGNSVQGTVPVRIGVADRLTIAGTTIRNVAFLIIDDAQLTFPIAGGYSIQAILGLPVLRALERVRLDGASFTVEAPQPYEPARQNLYAATNDLFVSARVGGRPVSLHLDSGANQTSLSSLFAAAHPAVVAGLQQAERRLAGAGGTRTGNTAVWREPRLELAGRSITLPSLRIGLPAAEERERREGTLGADALRRFASYTIDLKAMRLELGEPLPTPPSTPVPRRSR